MQWLAAICVRRPVFTWVLMLALVVVGTASTLSLGVDRFPNIDFPVVVVTTVLPGASPQQVETEVTDRIEEAVNTISGLDMLRSNSFEGLSVVVAQFDLDKDTSVAAQEVRDRVNRTLSLLPSGIQQPRVERMDPDAAPIMLIAVTGPRSTRDLTEFASRRVRRQIESLNGVGGVTVLGGRARQINVTLNPASLQSFGLTAMDVQRALATQNVEIPGGDVTQGTRTLQLRVQGRVESVDALAELTVSQRAGLIVRLRDVASVVDGEETPSSAASLNGRDVVLLAVRKQSGTNTVAVIDSLRERVDEIRRTLPPGFQLRIVRDESQFIRNAIEAVREHLIVGSILAAIVVLLFLWNGRSTIIAALAIPTSIIATFTLIKAMGLTLNVITMLGLTLAVGIVIDDAIVVLENIFRFIDEKGMAPRRAAILATREIGLAVLATTISLVAVFLPVAFMGGIVGRFMKSFGFTMSFSILISLLVAFTLTPMLSSRWLKPTGGARPKQPLHETDDAPEPIDKEFADPAPGPRSEERAQYIEWARGRRVVPEGYEHGGHGSGGLYRRVESTYLRVLAFVMRHRWIVGISIALALFAIGPLAKAVAKNFLPLDDESRFEVSIRAPEGTSLEQTRIVSERLAREVRQIPGVAYTVVTVGSAQGDSSGRGGNQAALFVALTDATQRARSQSALMEVVRDQVLPHFAGERLRVLVSPVNVFGGGGADSAGIQYMITGPELDHLADYSSRLAARLRDVRGTVDVDTTLVVGRPEFVVAVNRTRAADLGVSVADIANALRMQVGGVNVGTYSEGGEQYDIQVRAAEQFRADAETIRQITVPTSMPGRSVRLSDVVTLVERSGPTSIQRFGRQRMVMVYCNTLPGTSEAAIIARLEAARREMNILPGYSAQLAGRSRELGRAGRGFALAFILSLLFMYLVLAAQFESWIHPVTILASLPLTVPFALVSLIVLGQSLNIFSTLGILVLFGVVKKNSILQVDHMRDLRRRGLSRADAVMIGNRDRLRPILMTTIAFVAGMIPLVVSSGAGAGTNRAMGSVIIGGQTLSLALTLLATPVLYSWFDDAAHSRFIKAVGSGVSYPFRLIARLFERGDKSPPPASDDRVRGESPAE